MLIPSSNPTNSPDRRTRDEAPAVAAPDHLAAAGTMRGRQTYNAAPVGVTETKKASQRLNRRPGERVRGRTPFFTRGCLDQL